LPCRFKAENFTTNQKKSHALENFMGKRKKQNTSKKSQTLPELATDNGTPLFFFAESLCCKTIIP
jgi:hypothetical protein